MSDVKWIKILTDIFDDEKILLIETLPEADSIIVIWFKLLCLAGKQNNSGVFMFSDKIPYNEKMFATIFRRKESTVQLAFKTFEDFGMVEIVEGAVTIPNWGKHQNLEIIEERREYKRLKQAEYRAKQKQLTCGHPRGQNVDRQNKKEKENKKENIYSDYCSDNSELLNAFLGFEEMRKAIKKPLSDYSRKLSITALEKLSKDPQEQIEIINQSTLNNWKSFYGIKKQKSSNPFMDQLKKEVEDEQKGNAGDTGGNQSSFSRLLSGQQLK